MRPRRWTTVIILLGAIVSSTSFYMHCTPKSDGLAVLLRCPTEPKGRIELSAGENRIVADLKHACQAGELRFPYYSTHTPVTVSYKSPSSEKIVELTLTPGIDIAAGKNDYFVVIRIEDDPPSIKRDGI